jgi:hypothetical protein
VLVALPDGPRRYNEVARATLLPVMRKIKVWAEAHIEGVEPARTTSDSAREPAGS